MSANRTLPNLSAQRTDPTWDTLDALCQQVTPAGAKRLDTSVLPAGRPPLRRDEPRALVLPITLITCLNCGRTHRGANPHCLVRYGDPLPDGSLGPFSVKYTRSDVAAFTHLPREVKEYRAQSPFCEECFTASASRVMCVRRGV
jgi:hypothetical protein